ncbi:MAG: hypothetical protein ACYC6C_13875 [Coriobacteriia bacterium]
MDRSETARTRKPSRPIGWRLLGAALAVGLVASIASCGLANRDAEQDNVQFDGIQSAFDQGPGAFEAAAAAMRQLVAANPDAQRIAWTYVDVCITTSAEGQVCEDASAAEQQAYEGLPNADGVFYFARDADRYYIRFNLNDPPQIYAMYAPGDLEPADFAKSRGFRSFRGLRDGWSLLGSIGDKAKSDAQWLG